ncbi:MAG: GWxTD domain-containing protein [Candidatus Marinimicrobia bacterium]|nr:GWxTD domain-containing protein [Candidatus Neomarinimicrobiota bacterium]MCF7839550.1 GWxTD domain-containing protein [Candidatus Neomarinimicrobiota bacterium]MCF7901905.1 GWxTD domain-containing protein [Candidatus Neomarinimicrobiota bacterium]
MAHAQASSVKQGTHGDLGVAVDLAQYRLQGGVMLEVYLLVPRANFTYQPSEDGGYEARVFFQVALIQNDSVRYLDRWPRNYHVADLDELKGSQKIPDLTSFAALAGEYTLYVEVIDLNQDVRQTVEQPVNLLTFPDKGLTISDLELANNIVTARSENEFTKYGKDVVPNADRVFGVNSHLMYYFTEIYNLSGSGEYVVVNEVSDLNGEIVKEFPERVKKSPGTSAVDMGAVNINSIPSGIYQLRLRVTDKSTGEEATRSKTFYIYRPGQVQQTEAGHEYDKLDEEQLDQIYEVVKLVMIKREKQLYESSDVTGKRNVLYAFWTQHDPDPETDLNEYKQDFYERVEMANRELGTSNRPGWQTSRGRTLIKYGRPNEIERAPLTTEQRPYEIWYYYEIEGGVEFVFVDKRGYGDYELVHSTERSEVSDPNWQRWLK